MKILFVGSGEIGSRHVQAASQIKGKNQIIIIDPSEKSKNICKERINNTKNKNSNNSYHWFNDIDKIGVNSDLCIISTQARERVEMVKKIHQTLNIKNYLIEKVVSNSFNKILDLNNYSKINKLKIWVNCKTRAYEIHKHIKSIMIKNNSIDAGINFKYSGGNGGLFTSAIHVIDLFTFYDNSNSLKLQYSKFEDDTFITKRKTYDLNGTLIGVSNTSSIFLIDFKNISRRPDMYYISTIKGNFIVDHVNNIFFSSTLKNSWKWEKSLIKEDLRISNMSKKFIIDIVKNKKCDLPTLQESIISHEFLFNSVANTFQKKMNQKNMDLIIS